MVLKAIIQNENLGVEGRNSKMPDDATIRANQYRHPGRVSHKYKRFVSGCRNVRTNKRAIGDNKDILSIVAPISPTREDHAPASRMKSLRETRSNGRLPGASYRQSTHTHDGAREPTPLLHRSTHECAVSPRRRAVSNRRHPPQTERKDVSDKRESAPQILLLERFCLMARSALGLRFDHECSESGASSLGALFETVFGADDFSSVRRSPIKRSSPDPGDVPSRTSPSCGI